MSIPSRWGGAAICKVTFHLDANGFLVVSAHAKKLAEIGETISLINVNRDKIRDFFSNIFSSRTPTTEKNYNSRTSNILLNKLIEQKHAALSRVRRTPRFKTFLKQAAKISGWYVGMGAADMISSHYSNMEKEKLEREREQRLLQRSCEMNRFGCISNYCWSSCGPRIFESDYCFVTKDNNTKGEMKFVGCNWDSNCNGCWPCGHACIMESAVIPPNAPKNN